MIRPEPRLGFMILRHLSQRDREGSPLIKYVRPGDHVHYLKSGWGEYIPEALPPEIRTFKRVEPVEPEHPVETQEETPIPQAQEEKPKKARKYEFKK
jgi:hypothetical protein